MKLILIIALVCLSGSLGFGLSKTYKQKLKFYESYLTFLQELKTSINFSSSKIGEIVKSSKVNIANKDLTSLFDNYLALLGCDEKITRNGLFNNNTNFLTDSDKDSITYFFNQLGKTDSFNQIEIINNNIETVKGKCEKLKKDCAKYCPLFTKLGILFGLFLALIII